MFQWSLPAPRVLLISAMSHDRVIGAGIGMPWEVPEEYQHFLDTTRGASLILGRRSFEIFGPTLTCARCFVVTRRPEGLAAANDAAYTVAAMPGVASAIAAAQQHPADIYVAGGGQIYEQAISLADGMLLSVIPGDWTGDTYFPQFSRTEWRTVRQEDRGCYQLTQYERPVPAPPSDG